MGEEIKKEEMKDEEESKASGPKKAKLRRNGQPLDKDAIHHEQGHDLFNDKTDSLLPSHVRTGWPKKPEDYPPGYAVANPPGFCWEACDCMDDQRLQKEWEVNKRWLPL